MPRSKGKKKKILKSGMELKSSEGVLYQLNWPHRFLQFQYVTQSLTYTDLNLSLLFAGELEILSCVKSNTEMRGRLNLLRILAYESNVYPFKAISEWYGAFLKAIEMGMGSWLDSPYVLGQAILAKYKPVTKESPTKRQGVSGGNRDSKQKPMVWFCAGFNRGKCSKSSPHENKVRGKSVQVEHICAACWVRSSKKNVHAECSSACPLFSGSD